MYRQDAAYVKLRNGETVTIEGVGFVKDGDGIVSVGDTYIAERNQGPKLLTARTINDVDGYIVPVEMAYPYNIGECVKVRMVD